MLPPSPPLPEALARFLEAQTADATTPGERLQAAIDGLREAGYVSHGQPGEEPSRSGHALDRLDRLATDRPMIGDGEQYAVTAALLAREIGFPARVVVGYLPAESPVKTDAGVVFLGADRQAWIEIQTDDGEWRQVDPNPPVREVVERQPDEPTIISRPQSALPPPEARTPVEEFDDRPDASPDDRDAAESAWPGVLAGIALWTGGVLVGAAILGSPFLAIVAAKLRRRRIRRRAASPEQRIEGGWAEFADTAVDYGFPIAPTATRSEQAAGVGGLDAIVLAGVIDRMLFAPGEVPDTADDRVWSAVDGLRSRFAAEAGLRGRLRAAISLGSLGGYAVTRRGGRS